MQKHINSSFLSQINNKQQQQQEMLNKQKISAKLNFNHEFTEKFSVLDEKRFKNKIKIESFDNKIGASTSKMNTDLKLKNLSSKMTSLKNSRQQTKQTFLSNNSNQINTSAFSKSILNKTEQPAKKVINCKQKKIDSTKKESASIKKPVLKQEPVVVKPKLDSTVPKKRTFSTTVLNTKAKLLNRVKKQKKSKLDNKLSADLLNELMTSLIAYLNENRASSENEKKVKKTKTKKNPESSKFYTCLTDSSISEPISNHIMEQYLLNTFTDPMDMKTNILSTSPLTSTTKSSSSSYSSLSRTTTSSNSSSSYFKMFSRPNYYKTLNDNKNNSKPLPLSSTCSSTSSSLFNANRHSSLYLSCDETDKKQNLSNNSTTSSTSSQRHRQLEIPNIDDPILFIDTLYNQLLANNSTLSTYKDLSDSNNTEKIYDTDYTCRSSSRLITSDNNLTPNSHSRRSSVSSCSIEASDDAPIVYKPNLLLATCESITNENKISVVNYPRRKSISNFNLNSNEFMNHSITVDCSNLSRPELKINFTNQNLNYLMTSSSQSSPSLSFLSSSGIDSTTDKSKPKFKNRTLYLSASMANLYSSSSFSPSMSTSMSSNNQNISINNNTTTNMSMTSNQGSFKSANISSTSFLYKNKIQNSLPTTSYFSNNASLLIAKTNISKVNENTEATNYIQLIFESFLKSIKFLIMTKNVLILPIIIYLLNNKFKQFIKSTNQSTSSSLFSTAASSIVTSASKSAKLKLNLN